jgi:hypothetical protein
LFFIAVLHVRCGTEFLCGLVVWFSSQTDLEVEDWWNTSLAGLPKELRGLKQRSSRTQHGIYIWKARNRRVFDNLMAIPAQVEEEIEREIALCKRALGERVEANFFHD